MERPINGALLSRRVNRFVLSFAAGLLLLASGCGERLQRAPASGTVTVGDTPLPFGSIFFIPGRESKAPKAAARIVDGKFELDEGSGPVVGRHEVRIYAEKRVDFPLDDPAEYAEHAEEETQQQIARRYNVHSVLSATVKANEENWFESDVEYR